MGCVSAAGTAGSHEASGLFPYVEIGFHPVSTFYFYCDIAGGALLLAQPLCNSYVNRFKIYHPARLTI